MLFLSDADIPSEEQLGRAEPGVFVSEEAQGRKIVFEHTKSPDYRKIYVNGAWGGVTPKGELNFELFQEKHVLPEKIVHAINPDGTLGRELAREPGTEVPVVQREAQAYVTMSIDSARSIANWMLEKVKDFEAQVARRVEQREAKPKS